MPQWITKVKAIVDEKELEYFGDYIEADTQENARKWCEENGKGFLIVTDQFLVEEIEE